MSTNELIYQVSRVSDKRIAIKFDTYDSAKHFLSFLEVEGINYFHDHYEDRCIIIYENSKKYSYCNESFFIDEEYSILKYEDLYVGDFYIIDNKVVLIKE